MEQTTSQQKHARGEAVKASRRLQPDHQSKHQRTEPQKVHNSKAHPNLPQAKAAHPQQPQVPKSSAPAAPVPAPAPLVSIADPPTQAKKRYAILIDADNANPNYIEDVISFVNLRGETFIRRAYGDWTSHHLAMWKKVLQGTAIQPMQQFANTTGKNSTDAAMIIDAMDLLHMQKDLGGMCIVSSDSDFTRLVQRIRQDGLEALGFGEEKKTGKAFIMGCNEFYYVEHLRGTVPPSSLFFLSFFLFLFFFLFLSSFLSSLFHPNTPKLSSLHCNFGATAAEVR